MEGTDRRGAKRGTPPELKKVVEKHVKAAERSEGPGEEARLGEGRRKDQGLRTTNNTLPNLALDTEPARNGRQRSRAPRHTQEHRQTHVPSSQKKKQESDQNKNAIKQTYKPQRRKNEMKRNKIETKTNPMALKRQESG